MASCRPAPCSSIVRRSDYLGIVVAPSTVSTAALCGRLMLSVAVAVVVIPASVLAPVVTSRASRRPPGPEAEDLGDQEDEEQDEHELEEQPDAQEQAARPVPTNPLASVG